MRQLNFNAFIRWKKSYDLMATGRNKYKTALEPKCVYVHKFGRDNSKMVIN